MGSFDPTVLLTNLGMLSSITLDIAILAGICLIGSSVLVFKRYGEMRGALMSHQMTAFQPLMLLVAGAGLLMLPSVSTTFISMIFGNASPLTMTATGLNDWDTLMESVVVLTRLIGVIAFARGLSMLGKAGSINRQPGTIGRGFIFLIAGILCIHIIGTISLLEYILGVV
jgi:intracellular multiplication protein IcmC